MNKSPEVRIPFLPILWRDKYGQEIDLGLVPDGPSRLNKGSVPTDAELKDAQDRWLYWAAEIVRYRESRIAETHGLIPGLDQESEQAKELVRCMSSPSYFITIWTHVFEFRKEERSNFPWYKETMGGWLPFVPFRFQIELIDWFFSKHNGQTVEKNGAVSKSRDMGITDTCCRFALWHFLFVNPSHVKFISRKAELVDQIGNMDSILERVASHLVSGEHNATLPVWMLPDGFTGEEHRKLMFIKDPSSRNQISGESTTQKAGRGGRAQIIFIDEAAFIKELQDVLTATQSTAPIVIGVSSESAKHGEGFIKWQESLSQHESDALVEIDYWMHPFHDSQWLEEQKRRYGDNVGGYEAEILRDPYAAIGERMYPTADDIEFLEENVSIKDHPGAYLCVGIDPGLADQTALHWFMYNPSGRDVLLESLEIRQRMPADYIAAIIAGVDPDKHPEFRFPPEVEDIMAWVRDMPEPDFILGDPYGYREHSQAGDSWYENMYKFWSQKNPRLQKDTGLPNVYPIRVNWKKEAQRYRGRRQALMRRLRNMDFNDTPQVRATVNALQRSRWEDSDNTRRVTEAKTASHDIYSHRRSALEYIAVNLDVLEGYTDSASDTI